MVTRGSTGRNFRDLAQGFGVCTIAVLILYLITGMHAINMREAHLSALMAILTASAAFYVTSAFIDTKKRFISIISAPIAFGIYMLVFKLSFGAVGRRTLPCIEIMESVLMWAGLGTIVVSAIVLALGRKFTAKDLVTAVLAAGFVMRSVMVLFTPLNFWQHDVSSFSPDQAGFHDTYILYIYNNFTIPDVDVRDYGQFYHPPLHYIVTALFFRLQNVLPVKFASNINGLKMLPMLWTSYLILFAKKILEQLKIEGRALGLSLMLIVFCPQMIFLSIQVNNDALALMLFVCSVFLALKWYSKPEFTTILLLAISIGCAMMTKLSMGFVALPVAWIFAAKLIKNGKKKAGELIKQFAAFALAVFPLGLWFPLRNLIQYGVPMTYVYEIDSSANMDVWMYSPIRRLLIPSKEILSSPYLQQGVEHNDFNIFLGLIKSGLFDDRTFENGYLTGIGMAMVVVSAIMVILFLISAVIGGADRFKESGKKIFENTEGISLWILTAVLVISEIVFCFKHPVVCTEAFRYIAPVLVPAAFAGGSIMQKKGRTAKVCSACLGVLTVVFVLLVILFYGPFAQYAGPWEHLIRS